MPAYWSTILGFPNGDQLASEHCYSEPLRKQNLTGLLSCGLFYDRNIKIGSGSQLMIGIFLS